MSTKAERAKEVFGTPLSDSESRFLKKMREFVLHQRGKRNLSDIGKPLLEAMVKLRPHAFDVESAIRAGVDVFAPFEVGRGRAKRRASGTRRPRIGSREDLGFLDQVVGTIDFAVRNNVGIRMVFTVLSHDFAEILGIHGGSLQRALEMGFRPAVTHWASLRPESFGEAPEED